MAQNAAPVLCGATSSEVRVTTADQVSIGVVIRTRDRPLFVQRAIASVQAQTHLNWHIILVNDGGDAMALGKAIAAQRRAPGMEGKLTVLDLSPGVGRSAAFNRGAEALSTELVACLDDDDTWASDFMAALAAFYLQTRATVKHLGGVGAQVTALKEDLITTEQGQEIHVIGEEALPPSFSRPEFFLNPLAYACYRQDIYPVQWILRRDAVLATGGFPEEFDVMEDRAFLNRFLARYRVAMLDRKLAYHHRRVARAEDRERNVLLNTLDNPSYDWRLFSDLARPGLDLEQSAEPAAVVRSILADLLSEVNYETSAIWQKVDGEMASLKARLDHDKTELLGALAALAAQVTGQPEPLPQQAFPDIPVAQRAYDLWRMVPAGGSAQHLSPGKRFAGQLEMSIAAPLNGLMLHAAPHRSRLDIQIPATGDWAAIELSLDGLRRPGEGVQLHLQLSALEDYLFETALVRKASDATTGYDLGDFQVHACFRDTGCLLTRRIEAAWLDRAQDPKLSIILPRQAANFRWICHNLILERLRPV